MGSGTQKTLYELQLKDNNIGSTLDKLAATQKKFEDNFGDLEAKAHQSLGNIQSKWEKVWDANKNTLNNFTNSIPGLSQGLQLLESPLGMIGIGATGIALGFKKATEEAEKFERSFLKIQDMNLSKSREQLEDMADKVLQSSAFTGQNPEAMSKAYFDIQSLFPDEAYSNIQKEADRVGKFSWATDADFNPAMDAVIKAQKNFNISVKDTDDVLKSNFATVQTGLTTYAELAQYQSEFGAAGGLFGKGIEGLDESNKLFTIFSQVARDARVGATETKTALEGLTNSETIKNLHSVLGVDVYDKSTHKARRLDDVVGDIVDKFKHLRPDEMADDISKIGGTEGFQELLKMLGSQMDKISQQFKDFDGAKSMADLNKIIENANDNLGKQADMLNNQVSVAWANLGRSPGIQLLNRFWLNIEKGAAGGLSMFTNPGAVFNSDPHKRAAFYTGIGEEDNAEMVRRNTNLDYFDRISKTKAGGDFAQSLGKTYGKGIQDLAAQYMLSHGGATQYDIFEALLGKVANNDPAHKELTTKAMEIMSLSGDKHPSAFMQDEIDEGLKSLSGGGASKTGKVVEALADVHDKHKSIQQYIDEINDFEKQISKLSPDIPSERAAIEKLQNQIILDENKVRPAISKKANGRIERDALAGIEGFGGRGGGRGGNVTIAGTKIDVHLHFDKNATPEAAKQAGDIVKKEIITALRNGAILAAKDPY